MLGVAGGVGRTFSKGEAIGSEGYWGKYFKLFYFNEVVICFN
jgi:hypothetical protein